MHLCTRFVPMIELKLVDAILDFRRISNQNRSGCFDVRLSWSREGFKNASPPLQILLVGSTSPSGVTNVPISTKHQRISILVIPLPLMDSSTIPTSSEPSINVGSTSGETGMYLTRIVSPNPLGQVHGNMPNQAASNRLEYTETSRRILKEPRTRSKQIPFRKPPGHIAQVEKHNEHRKASLTVHVPLSADLNLAANSRISSNFSGTTISEILDLDPSQSASPESTEQAELDTACQPVHGNTPISKYLPDEAQFHFDNSLQVQAQDLPTIIIPKHTQLFRDDPSISVTYDRVWDPLAPSFQGPELPKDASIPQPYPSPAPTTRSMSFSLPSNYTEPNIHHAPSIPPTYTVAPNDDPPTPAWKIASQSIVKAPKGPELARLEDCLSEDIAIRAVLNGWNSIGERWELPPFWRVIRVLDELIFGKFNPVVRLASLRVVHLLMRYHSDPSPERAKNMPKFYNLKYTPSLQSHKKRLTRRQRHGFRRRLQHRKLPPLAGHSRPRTEPPRFLPL